MEYTLDTWTSIFLIAAVQGLFLSILLFSSRNRSKIFLGILVFLFSFTLIEYVLFWTGYRFIFPHLNRISEPLFFLYGPIIYFYSLSLKKNESIKKTSILIHLFPFLISFFMMTPYYLLDGGVKIQYMTQRVQLSNTTWFFYQLKPWIQIVSMTLYTILSFKKVKSIESVNHQKEAPKKILILFSGFIISFASYYVMILTAGYLRNYDYAISISMSVFIYGIGYLAFNNKLITKKEESSKKYQNTYIKKEEIDLISNRLIYLMESEKLYLQRDLSLNQLASATNTSKHILSQVLNDGLNTKFSDFINKHRINEAKELILKKNQELSISGIAIESGFNNKTSFNTAFKKFTGYTPTQYLDRNLHKAVNSD
tara:strand:- start:6983 stop:8089 length:1107 start_codon:yes stop_codon:yes gene_type:complete